MATDEELNWADSDSLEVWAPIHAWRALGQLRAAAAAEPLLSLFESLDESDWVMEELPEVFALIGPAALPALATYIADMSYDEEARISAIPSVEKIGSRWPQARPAGVALLMKQLERFAENEPEVNGFLVLGLVELRATEAVSLIERAFAARRVRTRASWEIGMMCRSSWVCNHLKHARSDAPRSFPSCLSPPQCARRRLCRCPPETATKAQLRTGKPKARWPNSPGRKIASGKLDGQRGQMSRVLGAISSREPTGLLELAPSSESCALKREWSTRRAWTRRW